jgi:predicted ATP-binding protein involved in virulence
VVVEGLAARPDPVTYELNPDINIFYGLNGTGKTSLLKLISSAIRNDIGPIRRVPFIQAEVSFLVPGLSEPITRTITKLTVDTTPIPQGPMVQAFGGAQFMLNVGPTPGWTTVEPSRDTNFYVCSYLSIFRLIGEQLVAFEAQPYSEQRLDQLFAQQIHQRWLQYFNTESALVRREQEVGLAAILSSLFSATEPAFAKTTGNVASAYDRAKHFLERQGSHLNANAQQFAKRYEADPRLRAVVNDIEAVEDRIHHAELKRTEFERLVGEFISTNKHINFLPSGLTVTVPTGEIGIDLLSSGEKHVLQLLLESLASESSPILIDEPEMSLHIDWQNRLLLAMRTVNDEAQIVAATHSPEIMAAFADGKIFRL